MIVGKRRRPIIAPNATIDHNFFLVKPPMAYLLKQSLCGSTNWMKRSE